MANCLSDAGILLQFNLDTIFAHSTTMHVQFTRALHMYRRYRRLVLIWRTMNRLAHLNMNIRTRAHTHTHTKWLTEFSAHFLDWCIESLFPLPWRVISKYQEWKQIIYLCYKNDCRRHIAQLDPAFYKRENATRYDE